jgi:hypothetical protein
VLNLPVLVFVATGLSLGAATGAWWAWVEANSARLVPRKADWFNRYVPTASVRELLAVFTVGASWVLPFAAVVILPYRLAAKVSRNGVLVSSKTVSSAVFVGALAVLPFVAALATYRLVGKRRGAPSRN